MIESKLQNLAALTSHKKQNTMNKAKSDTKKQVQWIDKREQYFYERVISF